MWELDYKESWMQKNWWFWIVVLENTECPFDCMGHNKLENSERDGNTRPPDLRLEKTYMQVRKQQLELDMEQQTGSK